MISVLFYKNPHTVYEAFDGQTNMLNDLDSLTMIEKNYQDISKNYSKFNQLKHTLTTDPLYVDYSGNWLSIRDGKNTVKDGVKEDIQIMVFQENNTYILGMITITLLLISAFLIIKK